MRIVLAVFLLGLCAWSTGAFAQQLTAAASEQLKQITVRIIASVPGRELRRAGSGFVWPDSNHAVTALHVVAGAESVEVEYGIDGKYEVRKASVVRVLKAADLALLHIVDPLPRVPASIGNLGGVDRWIVGFPLGLADKWSRYLRMSEIAPKTLEGVLDEEPERELHKLGFPDVKISITSLQGEIVPGDSGAPIVDVDGRVAAIGNGGLKGGTVGLGWAIPAEWLNQLSKSTETNPNLTDEQWSIILNEFLYGSHARLAATGTRHFSSSFEISEGQPGSVECALRTLCRQPYS